MGRAIEIKLTDKQREDLRRIVRRPSESAGLVRRARVVLMSEEGLSGREIALRLDLSPEHVSVIRSRFRVNGVTGLAERPKSGRTDHAVSAAMAARLVQMAMSPPPAGRSRWTTRLLGKQVGLTAGCVSDVLRRNGLKPHLVRTYKVSRDPDFASKVKDVVGLYLNPPEHAVVLSVDEKTSIQALERTQLPLPLRSGRAARHTHDYKRHGVLDLYAALEVATGNVTHRVTEAHRQRISSPRCAPAHRAQRLRDRRRRGHCGASAGLGASNTSPHAFRPPRSSYAYLACGPKRLSAP
jgi:transposase